MDAPLYPPFTVASLLARCTLPRLEAQLLLLHVLGKDTSSKAWLLAHGEALVKETQAYSFLHLCAKRMLGIPLAYLRGYQEFWNLCLKISSDVLVPRADTETLVAWALEVDAPAQARVLDLGTGSGALALALQSERPAWNLTATDISTAALTIARANAQNLGLPIHFFESSWFSHLAAQSFHIIVSNPPYIAQGDSHLAALAHEPHQALVSGADGLQDLRAIIAASPAFLHPGGWLLLEHGHDQAAKVAQLLAHSGFTAVEHRHDLAGHVRCTGGRHLS